MYRLRGTRSLVTCPGVVVCLGSYVRRQFRRCRDSFCGRLPCLFRFERQPGPSYYAVPVKCVYYRTYVDLLASPGDTTLPRHRAAASGFPPRDCTAPTCRTLPRNAVLKNGNLFPGPPLSGQRYKNKTTTSGVVGSRVWIYTHRRRTCCLAPGAKHGEPHQIERVPRVMAKEEYCKQALLNE